MQFKFTALFDEETRKELKNTVLAFAKGIARNEIELAIRDEINRVGNALREQLGSKNDYRLKSLIYEQVQYVLSSTWGSVGPEMANIVEKVLESKLDLKINNMVEKVAKANIAEKLRKKTVWEAESQDEYVRKVVRAELRLLLKP